MQVSETDAAAESLVREAQRRIYRFPPGFAGFTAALEWEHGDESGECEATLRVGPSPLVELTGAEGQDWIVQELTSILAHRAPRASSDGDGAFDKRFGATELLGARVEIADSMESSYVIGDGRIALVSRAHGTGRFTIAIQSRDALADGSELPTAFTVFYWDEAGTPTAAEAFTDAYAQVDGVLVPAARTVVRADDTGLGARKLLLSGHELLPWSGQ